MEYFVFGSCVLVQLAYWGLLYVGFRRSCAPSSPARSSRSSGSSLALQQAEETTLGDRPDRKEQSGSVETLPPMSVVVAARNEAAHLPRLLVALAKQTHPAFEVVVVDDASTDATPEIVQAWAETHPNVRLVRITQPQAPRKKHALTAGIAAATYEHLAFTDADCVPPPGWLAALARAHGAHAGETLLVGYSPFRRASGVLGRLACYETFVTGVLTAAAIGLHQPYMAVGRNLSYTRTLFRRIDGFAHSLRSLSGDDDLLVQEVARRRAAAVRHVCDAETFVLTDPPPTWRAWIRQKKRHTSAGRFYARNVQFHLALFQATSVALWLAPLFAGWTGALLLGSKLFAQGVVLHRAARALAERDLLPAFPLLELLYAAYNAFIAPLGLVKVPERW